MKFSVLLSLYCKEKASYLDECLLSIKNQTVDAEQIVIVEDGPLTAELYAMLSRWEVLLPIKRVVLEKNVGLGKALNHGIKYCSHSLIARMDTDDICHPKRFEKQLHIFENKKVDICGSWISEFESNCEIITSYRKPPKRHDEIIKLSRLKNPLNHPSVMYRKSAVLNVKCYEDVLFFEDYHLWLKLIDSGARFHNIEESLVLMRAGMSQLSRRGGFKYALLELDFFKRCRREGLMPNKYVVRNTVIRFPLRFLPSNGLGKVYRFIRDK